MNKDKNILNKFNDLLHKKTGFVFHEKDFQRLESRLYKRIKKLNNISLDDYYVKLKHDEKELLELVNHIIVNETTFFRHMEHYKILVELIKELDETEQKIVIQSAGCSTGEEPYTIAMYLHSILKKSLFEKIIINAVDISGFNIKIAKNAVYTKVKIKRSGNKEFVKLYFNELNDGNDYEIKSIIKNKVNFKVGNLFDYRFPDKINFLFCRNVMIYFSSEKRSYLIKKFYDSMIDNSYLFLAPTESLFEEKHLFTRERKYSNTFYKKKIDKPEKIKTLKSIIESNKKIEKEKKEDEKEENVYWDVIEKKIIDDEIILEFRGLFDKKNGDKIKNKIKKIFTSKWKVYKEVEVELEDIKFIDRDLLKDIGIYFRTELKIQNKIKIKTNKSQILRILHFHDMNDYFEVSE